MGYDSRPFLSIRIVVHQRGYMAFLYADELKQRFRVMGHYYDLDIGGEMFPCRSVADILSVDTPDEQVKEAADAVVIMMNPGSSRPLDESYLCQSYTVIHLLAGRRKKRYTQVRPDNTQYQIMRLMVLKGWHHVRILNLSDLRDGNSGSFAKAYVRAAEVDSSVPHSLLHPKRHKELIKACNGASVVIAAWGSNAVQQAEAEACIQMFKNRKALTPYRQLPSLKGLVTEHPWYRFASPYRKDQKTEWLKKMQILLD